MVPVFEHDIIVINSSNKIGYSRLNWFSILSDMARQQIMAEEDKRIFEIIDALGSGNNDI